jgi:excisionase family DNA binding protein
MIKHFLTQKEAAQVLGVTAKTFRAWIKRGVAPKGVKLGLRVRYRKTDIEKIILSEND